MRQGFETAETHLRSAISKVISRRHVLNFGKNKIFQGNAADALFHTQTGRVKLSVRSPSGKEATLSMCGANELSGLGCLGSEKRRLGTASAVELSELIRIDRDSWFKLLRDQPGLFEVALAHLSNRNVDLKKVCAQILDHSERRLARVLPKLTRIGVEQREPVVLPKISHETLASIVGTPRSRITYFMNCFRKRGLIDYKGRAMVRPSRLNVALQDE